MSDTEREESNTNHAESNMSTAQIGHNGPRWETMRDVSGDAYRTINTAYKEMCERIEADTEHRRFVRGTVSNAAHQGNLEQSERTDLVEQDHFPRD